MPEWLRASELTALAAGAALIVSPAADVYVRCRRDSHGGSYASFLSKTPFRPPRAPAIRLGIVLALIAACAAVLALLKGAPAHAAACLAGAALPLLLLAPRVSTPSWMLQLPLPARRDRRNRPVPKREVARELIDSANLFVVCAVQAATFAAMLGIYGNPSRRLWFGWLPEGGMLPGHVAIPAAVLILGAAYHVVSVSLEAVGHPAIDKQLRWPRWYVIAARWVWLVVLLALFLIILPVSASGLSGAMLVATLAIAIFAAHPVMAIRAGRFSVEGGSVGVTVNLIIGSVLRMLAIPLAVWLAIAAPRPTSPWLPVAVGAAAAAAMGAILARRSYYRRGRKLGKAMLAICCVLPLAAGLNVTSLIVLPVLLCGFVLGVVNTAVPSEVADDRRGAVLMTFVVAALTTYLLRSAAAARPDAFWSLATIAVFDLGLAYGGWLRAHAAETDF